ncbi:cbb3-type cytochrome oxidase assembly protein CcoS [Noviherbaspirillum aridicola]|uniref:Cytochrome oxidase maturation protein, cbb3-type n=1 Tax=Noviherbaspirillum aridicola TaxID=2849687 RepID=A0ABQ4Q3B2_9BURK|nr:cbb3-type cytochrome oxidase assembly protein CcoS [Noviherbaspirillum aridicola]GIZ51676.1 cytochrome oxidase maturation protein, cbb3-type [Noviherbaspirillum aridicola]
MESLYLLIPLSVLIVFIAIWIFFRASDGGQFDDLVGPGMRILQDDDRGQVVEDGARQSDRVGERQPPAAGTDASR